MDVAWYGGKSDNSYPPFSWCSNRSLDHNNRSEKRFERREDPVSYNIGIGKGKGKEVIYLYLLFPLSHKSTRSFLRVDIMRRYFENIFIAIWTILVGMRITLKHLFVPSVTLQYPDERWELPERARMRLYMKYDDCIGCGQCVRACPVDCIALETEKAAPGEDLGVTSDGRQKRLKVTRYDIDMSLCCYCGLCTYPCPTKCLSMTKEYEFTVYDRAELLYHFAPGEPRRSLKG